MDADEMRLSLGPPEPLFHVYLIAPTDITYIIFVDLRPSAALFFRQPLCAGFFGISLTGRLQSRRSLVHWRVLRITIS
jgi:hypothetical protein